MNCNLKNRIRLYQGESIDWEFIYADSEGTAIDITDHEIIISAKRRGSSNALLFRYTSADNEVTKVDAINGKTNVLILDTSSFRSGEYILGIAYKNKRGITSVPDQIILEVLDGVNV